MPRKRDNPEDRFHQDVRIFLDVSLPDDAWWTSIEHGANHGRLAGALMKARGVKPGIPDILIVWRGKLYAAELKAGKNQLTKVQERAHEDLHRAGAEVGTFWMLDGLAEWLMNLGMPLKGRVV